MTAGAPDRAATQAILAFAAARHGLPPGVARTARRLAADTLAVAHAGSTAPGADAVVQVARRSGAGADAPLIGGGGRLAAPAAALVNGWRIHCLEWDAVHEPAVVHALSVVTAAVHAVAHRAGGVDADDALEALAVGVEIASLLGEAAAHPLRFFRPATAGVMGAAVAAARLIGADTAAALGFALVQAAGTMQAHVEGSPALALQVGLAARAAVTAADCAAAGLSAPADMLEGPYGWTALYDPGDLGPEVAALGRRWRIEEVSIKPWPCGRAAHGLLGALEGRGDVGRIEAHVPLLVARLVGRPWTDAMTPAWARLCLPFLSALMLSEGRIDPRRFEPSAFLDPGLRALGARLSIAVDAGPDPNALVPQRLRLDGEEIVVEAMAGHPLVPRTEADTRAKEALALSLSKDPVTLFDPIAMLCGVP